MLMQSNASRMNAAPININVKAKNYMIVRTINGINLQPVQRTKRVMSLQASAFLQRTVPQATNAMATIYINAIPDNGNYPNRAKPAKAAIHP